MKRIPILGAILTALSLSGCQKESHPEKALMSELPSPSVRLSPVSVRLDSGGRDAKSVISVDAEDFRCAYLFAFDSSTHLVFLDEQGCNIGLRTESKTINWAIPVGPDGNGNSQVMDVYAIVNPDAANTAVLEDFLSRTDVTEEEVEALEYACGNALSLAALESEGMPMSACQKGITLDTSEETFTLSLKRLFARYDIRLNVNAFSQGGWTVEAAEVLASHSNTRASYFYTGEGVGVTAREEDLAMVDMATDSDLQGLNAVGADGKSAGSLTLYFLENCQGDIGPASAWNKVYADLGDAVSLCSFAEFVIRATHTSLGERSFKYRFYPGNRDDMCSNFDIIRNMRRKVSLSLSPDLSSEYFRWVYDGDLKVAPGEVLNLHYETTLEEEYLHFGTFLDGLPSDLLEVVRLHPGMVAVKARPDAPEGGIFHLQGGDASGQISDKVSIQVSSTVSFWKDVEVLYTPQYRGQWMVLRLNAEVFQAGDYVQASVGYFYRQADGSYIQDNSSSCSVDLSPDNAVFGNGKTGIYAPHLWFDPAGRLLFVYSDISRPGKDHYSTLILTVIGSDSGEEYEMYRKEYVFRQKEPLLRLRSNLSSARYSYETTISTAGRVEAEELYFVLVDPDDGRVIPNSDFRWGGYGNHAMPGMSYAPYGHTGGGFYYDNLFFESQIEYDYSSGTVYSDFELSTPGPPDEASWDFDLYNFTLRPRNRADFPGGEDHYYLFSHSFFSAGEIHIHPSCRLVQAPISSITLLRALGGTNDYNAMKSSSQRAGEDFYLMYGFRQTFFARLENLADALPAVQLDRESALRYSITKVKAGLYRLDLWMDRYETPGNDGALPYPPGQTGPEPEDGDYDVRITLTAGGQSTSIVCHVLHKRFRISLSCANGRDLQLSMWNPLGFALNASCSLNADYQMYWYRHPLKEHFDGPCFNRQSASFTLSASLAFTSLLGRDVSALLEKASRDLRGVRCTYARDVHPDFIAHNYRVEDLILYYPAAEALSLGGTLSLTSNGFVSSVAGLSLKDIVFNLENYISYSSDVVRFSYTLSTLSEYYLQTAFYEITDTWYYDYRFATPVHWSENNPAGPFHINSDAPVHIGGPDLEKSVSGIFLYRGNGSFHANDPVIGE